jgi:putative hydrolase of the HAD superfamily
MLKAILFDLDDTLLDWRGFKLDFPTYERPMLERVYALVEQVTRPSHDLETFFEDIRERTREGWRQGRGTLIAPHLGRILMDAVQALGVEPGRITMADCLKAYQWRAVPGTVVFPDVPAALAIFRQHGLKLAIVTNAHQPMSERDVEMAELGLLEYFPDFRISAADAGYLKPHPAIFQRTLEALGVEASEAVFVGDNPIADIAGSQGAGMYGVLRITTPVPPMLSGIIIPDAAINTLDELLPVLDKWYPGWRN